MCPLRRWQLFGESSLRNFFNSNKTITWKTLILLAVFGHIFRYLVVLLYCFACHVLLYRWSSCSNDDFKPKSFGDVSSTILASTSSCGGSESALIYVPSSFSDFGRRQLIRDTWAKSILDGPIKAKFVFVLGSPGIGQFADSPRLHEELLNFNDIIRLDVVDSYHNLTLKTRAIYNWTLNNCPKIEFLVRADSDIVLHAENLNRFLRRRRSIDSDDGESTAPLVFGHCRAYDCITRLPWSKSCLPRGFYDTIGKPLFYPSYCFGFSNIVSMEYVRQAVRLWTRRLRITPKDKEDYLPMEDLHSIGFTGESVGAWKIGHSKLFVFDKYFDSYSCRDGANLASASYKDDEVMKVKWEQFQQRCNKF